MEGEGDPNKSRSSNRIKTVPLRYGDPVDPLKLRKKRSKKDAAPSVAGSKAPSSARSSVRKKEVEVQMEEAMVELLEKEEALHLEKATLSSAVDELQATVTRLKDELGRVFSPTSFDMDATVKRKEELLAAEIALEDAQRKYNNRLPGIEAALRTITARKNLTQKKADVEKEKIDLEDEQEICESLRSVKIVNKEEAVKSWVGASNAKAQDNEDEDSEEDQDLKNSPTWNKWNKEFDQWAGRQKDSDMKESLFMGKVIGNAIRGSLPQRGRNQDTSLARQIHKQDLPKFSGSVEEWPIFLNAYDSSNQHCRYTAEENLVRLQKALKGDARELVHYLLFQPTGVPLAIDKLKKRYGNPSLLVNSLIEKITELPAIKKESHDGWIKFGSSVDNLVGTIQSIGARDLLSNPSLVSILAKKLPHSSMVEWERYKVKKSTYFPTLEDFASWLRPNVEAMYSLCPPTKDSTPKATEKKRKERVMVTNAKSSSVQKRSSAPRPCVCCGEGHHVSKCQTFNNKSMDEKQQVAREKRLCFGCLNPNHAMKDCRSKKQCGVDGCSYQHHRLLHKKKHKQEETKSGGDKEDSSSTDVTMCTDCGKGINYNVIPVHVKAKDGSLRDAYIALDSFASITAVSKDVVKSLGLRGRPRPLEVEGFQSSSKIQDSEEVDIEIVSKEDGHSYVLKNTRTVPSLKLPKQSVTQSMMKKFTHLSNVPLETYNDVRPTFLVGIDNLSLHVQKDVKKGAPGEPLAIRTEMGWALVGDSCSKKKQDYVYHLHERKEDPLHQLVKEYFSSEIIGIRSSAQTTRSKVDVRAQAILDKTVVRVGDHWESGLLWKEDDVKLPSSYDAAFNRLRSMERKMDADPEFAKYYDGKIQEYMDKNYATKVTPQQAAVESGKTYYLPHFMHFNPKKPGKLRFVFDAAARVKGVSLNDNLIPGPDKLVSLPGTLLKFRQKKIGIIGDISDMFHRVRVRPEDACAQRFLYRESARDRNPDVYQMNVLIFGGTCSPCCAQEAKNKNALEFKSQFPEACEAIIDRHYVDDWQDSCDTEEEAIQLRDEVIKVHALGSFHICNFLSNSKKFMDTLPPKLRSKVMDAHALDEDGILERVLGLFWKPGPDIFTFCLKFVKAKQEILSGDIIPTKREFLSLVSSIYDPLGLLSLFTVKAKILLQKQWRSGIGWDDPIVPSTHESWRKWLSQLNKIEEYELSRCYSPWFSKSNNNQLHVFVDASEEAYGCVGYFRSEHKKEVSVSLVMARSNVAPLRHLTIPKLELQAALAGARMSHFILEQVKVPIHSVVYWSDSSTVLYWIRSEGKRFQQYVGNRVGEIQDTTKVTQWRWIPTKENVADEITRLNADSDWSPESRWINGPNFLKEEEDNWPQETSLNVPKEAEEEFKPEQVFVVVTPDPFAFDPAKFSDWTKLIRLTAYVIRFVQKCRKQVERKGPLIPSELKGAAEKWCKIVQEGCFSEEIQLIKSGKSIPKGSRLRLCSPVYEDGLLRVGGRLDNASLPLTTRRPIILDQHHPYTKLLVRHFHEACGHQGLERIANELRQQYYVLSLKAQVKGAQNHCQVCKNRKAVPAPPVMGQLPKARVEPQPRPFVNSGVDYFGPIEVIVKRSREKRYVALFTCLATRAVHLELAGSLSTDSFIMALRRFSSRRGTPTHLHSDNGSNFVGADNELKKALAELNQSKLESYCANIGITWHFIPPSAPHMGGSWERLVRSVKVALGDTVKRKNLHEEVLSTLLTEAEHSVNSHPLTHVPVDPEDEDPLTPNHFLIGRSSNLQPVGEFGDYDLFGRKQWRVVQAMANHFWKRWIREYLPTLLRRQKWDQRVEPVQVNDICLEVHDNLPRNVWPKGRIVQVYPDKKGIIRVVDIKLANGHVFRRPVAKLCILDLQGPNPVPVPKKVGDKAKNPRANLGGSMFAEGSR